MKTIAIILAALALATPALAQSRRDNGKALERAQAAVATAQCRVDWLKSSAASGDKSKLAYHRSMADCLSRIAGK